MQMRVIPQRSNPFPSPKLPDPSFRNLWVSGGLHNCPIGSVVVEVLELAGLQMFQITIRRGGPVSVVGGAAGPTEMVQRFKFFGPERGGGRQPRRKPRVPCLRFYFFLIGDIDRS